MTDIELETARGEPTQFMGALTYKAPFVIEKLLKEKIVETAQEGEALFTEVVRYLILQRSYPEKRWEMFSRRVDEVWHQFVLFTVEYAMFCKQYFNGYLHHYPSNAPTLAQEPDDVEPVTPSIARADFVAHYEQIFGTPLPCLWFDASFLTRNQRVLRASRTRMLTVEQSAHDIVTLADQAGVIFSVPRVAD